MNEIHILDVKESKLNKCKAAAAIIYIALTLTMIYNVNHVIYNDLHSIPSILGTIINLEMV